jgi:Tfp pilus assembly protein PilN
MMIRINLAQRKQFAAAAASGDMTASTGLSALTQGAFHFDPRLDGLQELPLRKIGALAAVAVATHFGMGRFQSDQIKEVEAEIEVVRNEQTKLAADVGKTKEYLPLKKQLDEDEAMIRTKIRTVRSLIADRQTPPQLFAALSGATPREIWLSEVKIGKEQVVLKGAAASVGDIPDFMRMVRESAFFSDVALEETRAGRESDGQEIAQFSLVAKRRATETPK